MHALKKHGLIRMFFDAKNAKHATAFCRTFFCARCTLTSTESRRGRSSDSSPLRRCCAPREHETGSRLCACTACDKSHRETATKSKCDKQRPLIHQINWKYITIIATCWFSANLWWLHKTCTSVHHTCNVHVHLVIYISTNGQKRWSTKPKKRQAARRNTRNNRQS